MFKDAIDTAFESKSAELIEDLLKFFVARKDKEYFTCALYTCYEFVRPDLVLELSWRFGLLEYSMPFFVQVLSDLTKKVDTVEQKTVKMEKKED
jgi:clathrin heavy chain